MKQFKFEECEKCAGWCCISYRIPCSISNADIIRMANYLQMLPSEFKEEYIIDIPHFGKAFKYSRPCRFWTLGLCAVHKVKPTGCAAFKPLGKGVGNGACALYHKEQAKHPKDFKTVAQVLKLY